MVISEEIFITHRLAQLVPFNALADHAPDALANLQPAEAEDRSDAAGHQHGGRLAGRVFPEAFKPLGRSLSWSGQ